MKLDANDRTPENLALCRAAEIYLNGELKKDLIVTCDDQAGTATMYWKTITGKFAVIGFGNNKRLALRHFKGDVVIVIPAGVKGGPYRTPTKELSNEH